VRCASAENDHQHRQSPSCGLRLAIIRTPTNGFHAAAVSGTRDRLVRRCLFGVLAEMLLSSGSDFALAAGHYDYLIHQVAVFFGVRSEHAACASEQIQEMVNIEGFEQIMVKAGDSDGIFDGPAAVPRDSNQQRLSEGLFAVDQLRQAKAVHAWHT